MAIHATIAVHLKTTRKRITILHLDITENKNPLLPSLKPRSDKSYQIQLVQRLSSLCTTTAGFERKYTWGKKKKKKYHSKKQKQKKENSGMIAISNVGICHILKMISKTNRLILTMKKS